MLFFPIKDVHTVSPCAILLEDLDAFARLAAHGAIAIDMETSAIAAVCERAGCRWSVFRGMSGRADELQRTLTIR